MLSITAEWLREKCKKVSAMYTRNHHKIINQFIDFKNRTLEDIKTMEEYAEKAWKAEACFALWNPVYEAEYAILDSNPLKLYDCIVP